MTRSIILMVFASILVLSCATTKPPSEEFLRSKALTYAQEFILIDTHVDTPYRLREKMENISQQTVAWAIHFRQGLRTFHNIPI